VGKTIFFNSNNHLKLAKILSYLSKKRSLNNNYSSEFKKNQFKTKKFIMDYLKIIKINTR
jgi:hypothetical protein